MNEVRKRAKNIPVYVNCGFCNKEFKTSEYRLSAGRGIYCSRNCKDSGQTRDGTVHLNCLTCNEGYVVTKSQVDGNGSKYCSMKCRNIADTKKVGLLNPLFTSILIECEYCKIPYYAKKHVVESDHHNFCSKDCRQTWFSEVWSQTEEWKEESKIRAVKMLENNTFGKTDTGCQIKVNNILDNLRIKNVNEYNCKYVSIDNHLTDYNLMIEVMGTYWHCDPQKYKTIGYQNQVDRIRNDKSKNTYIKNNYNIEILYIWEEDITNKPDLCEKLIYKYVEEKGIIENYHSFNYSLDINNKLILNIDKIVPYFHYDINDLKKIIDIRDLTKIRSRKQLDRWTTFNCENCGDEKEQLIKDYKNNKTHCCSKECSCELKKKNNLIKRNSVNH